MKKKVIILTLASILAVSGISLAYAANNNNIGSNKFYGQMMNVQNGEGKSSSNYRGSITAYDLSTNKAKKEILPGISYVQTLVEQGRLKVASHCTNTLASLDQYRWDMKEGLQKEKTIHDQYSHMADAFRYALYSYTI